MKKRLRMAHLITILIGMKPPDGTSALVRVQVIWGSALDGFFKIKWASRSLFFVYFRSFQTNNTFLQQINVKICPSSIWCWDSNPQPLKHESSPNTLKIVYDIRPMCFFPVQLLQYFLHNWMLLLRRFPHWGPILQVFLTLITYWCKKVILDLVNKQHCIFGAGITQWIRLHLPYCGPGFESQAHHQYIFHLLSILYYYCHCVAIRTKTNKKRPSLANMKNKLHI